MKSLLHKILVLLLTMVCFHSFLPLYAEQVNMFFVEDGYVLNYDDTEGTKKIEFTKNTDFKRDVLNQFTFKDNENEKQKIKNEVYMHYQSGAMSATSDSVFILLDSLKKETGYIEAYYIKENEVISNTGDVYYIDNNGGGSGSTTIDFESFIWKMSDTKFMIVSSDLIVNINGEDIDVTEFAEVEFIDEGVIQIQTIDNVWKTISKDATIRVGDKQVHLSDKFVSIDDEVVLSLNKIAIDADDNIVVTPSEKYKKQLSVPKITIKAEDGKDGEQGEHGISGDSGTSGTTGGTGSTGGSSGSGSTSNETKIYPVFYIENWQLTSNSLIATISVEDEQSMLSEDEAAIIQVVRADTQEVVYELSGENGHNFGILPECTIDTGNILQPDHQYILKVRTKYIPVEEGSVLERDFIYKKFFTDSSGLFTVSTYASVNSVSFDIHHQNYSNVTEVVSYLFDDFAKAQRFTPESVASNVDIINQMSTSFTQNTEEIKSITFSFDKSNQVLKSNTNYYVRLVAKSIDTNSLLHENTNMNVVQLKTLKKNAVIGEPIVTQNRITFSFDFKPAFVTDPDQGIEEYIYEIFQAEKYEAATTDEARKSALITTCTSTSKNTASIPIDGTLIQSNVNYIVKLYARFNNNQNIEILDAPKISPYFAMAGVSMPTVTFVMNPNDALDETNRISRYHDKIVGTLVINTENADILIDDAGHPLILTIEAPGDYLLQKQYTTDDLRINKGQISITPVLEGLKKASQYKFTVSGYVDLKDGTYNSSKPEKKIIGSYVVSTASTNVVKGNWKSSVDNGTALGVYFSLSDNDINNPTDYEMDTSTRIVFNLYEGSESSKKIIGTFPLEDSNAARHESEFVNGTTHKIYNKTNDPNFNGILLTEKNFGLTSGSLSAYTYTIEVEGLYDYTTKMTSESTNVSGYVNTISMTSNEFVVTKRNAPPELPKQNQGVTVFPITNLDSSSFGGIKDNYLADDVIVGYRLEANYDNSVKLGRTINFYAFESSLYNKNFVPSDYENSYQKNEIYLATGSQYKDPVTADAYLYKTPKINFTNNGFGPAPQVILFLGNPPANQIESGVNDKGQYFYYMKEYDPTTKRGVSRGMQLKFAYTAELSLSATTTVDSYFPYIKSEYGLYTYHMPASPTIDLPKSDPLVYAYPWSSNARNVVWKYFIYDPDSALVKSKVTNIDIFSNSLLLNGSTFLQNYSTEFLPGFADVTEEELACKVGQEQINGCIEIATKSDFSGVNEQVVENMFKYVSFPSSALNSVNNLVSSKVSWYRDDIYMDTVQIDINSSAKKVLNNQTSNFELNNELSLFNLYYDKDLIQKKEYITTPNYEIEVGLNLLDDNIILFNVRLAEEQAKRLAGIQAIFSSTTDVSKTIRINKKLDNISISNGNVSGSFTVNTSEIAALVGHNINVEAGMYLYTGEYGFSARTGYMGIRHFSSYGVPGEYTAYNDLQDLYVNRSTTEPFPAMGSMFTKISLTNYNKNVNMIVNDLSRSNHKVSFLGTNFANLYANFSRAETANSFTAPAAMQLIKYHENKNTVLTKFKLSSITPTIKVNPLNGIKISLTDVTLVISEIAGAKENVMYDSVYFQLAEINGSSLKQISDPRTTGNGNFDDSRVEGYWKLTLNELDKNNKFLFGNLEINKNYQIIPYVIMKDGQMVQLIDGSETSFQKKAIYYAKTSSNVSISNLSITKVATDYFDKRIVVNYAVDQTLGYEIIYNIYKVNELDEKTDLLISKNHNAVFSPVLNQIEFKTGPAADSEVQLEAGKKYMMELQVFPRLEDGSPDTTREIGSDSKVFEMTSFSSPIAYSSSLPQLQDGKHSLNFKLTISDIGRFLSFDKIQKGDYYVEVKPYDSQKNEILLSGYYSSALPNTLEISDLDADSSYVLSVYAVIDELGIGKDLAGDTLPLISEIVDKSLNDPTLLNEYLIYSTSAKTMNDDGIDFGNFRVDIRNTNFLLNFSQAVGIDKVKKMECSLSYISNNVVYSERLDIVPTIETLDQSLGAYSIALPFKPAVIESNYNVTLKLFDENSNLLNTISQSIYYKP